jgi:hypothetical protein
MQGIKLKLTHPNQGRQAAMKPFLLAAAKLMQQTWV